MTYWIARLIVKLIVRLTSRVEVQNIERLPKTGAFAIASNHLGRLDPLLVYYLIDRKDVILLIAEKYRQIPMAPWFVRQLNGIFVDRYGADVGAVRQALHRLKQGWVLVLAPEGTRSHTEALIEGHYGVSYLAARAGVPIYPVGVTGTEDRVVAAGLKRLRRARVKGTVGEPFTLPELDRKDREKALAGYTEEIMCRIAALLPPKYRGFYADHPRLQELLDQGVTESGKTATT